MASMKEPTEPSSYGIAFGLGFIAMVIYLILA